MESQPTDNSSSEPRKRRFLDRFKRSKSEEQQPQDELVEPIVEAVTEVPDQPQVPPSAEEHPTENPATPDVQYEEPQKERLRTRMRRALSRTGRGVGNLFLGQRAIDDDLFEELEMLLLMADVGIEATTAILQELTDSVKRKALKDNFALQEALNEILLSKLQACEKALDFDVAKKPYVLMVVGVNGVGKTTTIGKLAKQLQLQGKTVMLAAGDTFRAAAVEQLQAWGEKNNVPVVAQQTGADSASVIFDAIQSAQSKNIDVIIADTAGRLHNKSNLMEELKKISRVAGKLDSLAPHEVLLVLDSGTGQNAVSQMAEFHQAAGVTGVVLTKLDGTAKGGVIFALAEKFGVPIRYIGVGEGQDDLQPFVAKDFVEALLASSEG